jgi:FkbM family methyltransferase
MMDIFFAGRFDPIFTKHPLVLIDVGARGGLKADWAPARRHLRTVGFEPDPKEHARLVQGLKNASSRDRVLDVALHESSGSVRLHLTKNRALSSLYEPNHEFLKAFPEADRFAVEAIAEMRAEALDTVISSYGIEPPDFMKVDTQGSELSILRGGVRAISSHVMGVEVEVEFSPIYKGQPLFPEVDAFLRSHGLQLFDLRPCYWKRTVGTEVGGPYGQIVWADALYLTTANHLQTILTGLPLEERQAKLLKALSIALLYGYRDYALDLLQEAGGCLDGADRAAIEVTLRTDPVGRSPLPRFPGKSLLAAGARRLAALFADTNGGWSVGEGRTGNHW